MLGSIEKTDLKPRETSAGKCADYKRGAPENSGEPRDFVRQPVSQDDQETGASYSGERDPSPGRSQKPW